MIMSRNEENFQHLTKIFPLIFQLFHSNWSENLQFLAVNCIFLLISIPECKELLLKDKNKIKMVIQSPLHQSSERIEYLRQNILYEINGRFIKENELIIFSFHENDRKNVIDVAKFFRKKTNRKNIFFLNSKCKKKKTVNNFYFKYLKKLFFSNR